MNARTTANKATGSRKSGFLNHRTAQNIPVPHPSWFGRSTERAEQLPPEQFWRRLGI